MKDLDFLNTRKAALEEELSAAQLEGEPSHGQPDDEANPGQSAAQVAQIAQELEKIEQQLAEMQQQ